MGEEGERMSQTFSLACRDCKKHVWIAQGHKGNIHLYSGEKETMEMLKRFLETHTEHNLFFADNGNDDEIAEMEEVKE
jgi:hypothetical protein